jgi:hypothetical protein
VIQETLDVAQNDSALAKTGGIIVSAVAVNSTAGKARLVVGRPGLANVVSEMAIGDAVLFETPDGLFEVRLLSISYPKATVLLSQVAPRPGIAGGFVDQDASNSRFTTEEVARIGTSMEQILEMVDERSEASPEQLAFIAGKLKYMEAAASRMGRKDWMNLALGTMTSIIVTAAFTPGIAKALLQAADIALSWVFGGGMKLLP